MPNQTILSEDLKRLLATPDLADLGPACRSGAVPKNKLNERIDALFSGSASDRRVQDLIRGTLLLWHDHLDAAHEIAQNIEDADGSLLHGLMHRREPDYGNAKYWFRRVGQHPCYGTIATQASLLLRVSEMAPLATKLIRGGAWDSFAFIDACEAVAGGRGSESVKRILQEIQRIEFTAFLEQLSSQIGR
jgi:hypothetical protein